MKDIILAAINAKWIHPSLALRLLKANLGALEERCEIVEFALRQPLGEKLKPLLDFFPADGRKRVLGISVSIWNHTQTIELLKELDKARPLDSASFVKPAVILGGPEVSHLPPDAEIFKYADHVIRGEGETAFRLLCERTLSSDNRTDQCMENNVDNSAETGAETHQRGNIKSAYYLYTAEDIAKKLIYAESSRGCPFKCEFCLSSADDNIYEFPLDEFLKEMDRLIERGAKTIKFLDRSFNVNIPRALRIIGFFLDKIDKQSCPPRHPPFTVHFEMVPFIFPQELREILTRFPPGSLRLEIGIQSLNAEVCARLGRPSNPDKELEALRFLHEKTNAIIHADLIAGLPGEDLASFGRGFDRLWQTFSGGTRRIEIQSGVLKLLPGAPIARLSGEFAMRYSQSPPYEVIETSAMSAGDIARIKNFARFWELIVNRKIIDFSSDEPVFDKFLNLSSMLFNHFGRNWGIDRDELTQKTVDFGFSGYKKP